MQRKISTSFSLDADLLAELDVEAARGYRTRSALLTKVVEDYLKAKREEVARSKGAIGEKQHSSQVFRP